MSAHRAWQKDKIQTLNEYSCSTEDPRVKSAIKNIMKRIETDYNYGKITNYIIRGRE